MTSDSDRRWMQYALDLARRGQGAVEPNPMVGCAIVVNDELIAEGWHERFGGPHAEVNALAACQKEDLTGATLYVTLEPCAHHGKTPPCSQALIESGIKRVVIAMQDPFPQVDGRGIEQLREAGIEVITGVAQQEAELLNAPFVMQQLHHRPWVIGKWAMTLDGKIATHTGSSQWVSNEKSRAIVHQIRGRMDAIVVGHQTALADNPSLNARPAGPRMATRIVVARTPALPLDSHLVSTAKQQPVIVTAGPEADPTHLENLRAHGVEILTFENEDEIVRGLLRDLAGRDFTNVLIEGGAALLGACLDQNLVDEVHVFVAPKLVGAQTAPSPIGGTGIERMQDALPLKNQNVQILEEDIYISGIVSHIKSPNV